MDAPVKRDPDVPSTETQTDDKRYERRHPWYLDEARVLVRQLQAVVWPLGYHIALGGGVLTHGYSDKDLDLYVLPLGRFECESSYVVAKALLQFFGSKTTPTAADLRPAGAARDRYAYAMRILPKTRYDRVLGKVTERGQVELFVVARDEERGRR